jgi:hypothetical protein
MRKQQIQEISIKLNPKIFWKKKFNSLAINISILARNKSTIEKNLNQRDGSSYFPQDSWEVVQTDLSSFEPFED